MMWPILTKVQYESLPRLFTTRNIYLQILLSLFLNWIIGPLIMLGVAWATLPDLPTYRTGVIMVGLARCIAMVMIWNQLAGGDSNYCAILVVINSVLQIILYSPYSLLFVNVIGGEKGGSGIHVSYGEVAISVLIVCLPLRLARRESNHLLVPWHTACTGFDNAGHHVDLHFNPFLLQPFPPAVLSCRTPWSSLYHRCHVRLSRSSHPPQFETCVPRVRSDDPILRHHVVRRIRSGVAALPQEEQEEGMGIRDGRSTGFYSWK